MSTSEVIRRPICDKFAGVVAVVFVLAFLVVIPGGNLLSVGIAHVSCAAKTEGLSSMFDVLSGPLHSITADGRSSYGIGSAIEGNLSFRLRLPSGLRQSGTSL
jgi:hypothetical protein